MTTRMKTRDVHLVAPLQTIASITPTGRVGTEISPHHFWLDREYHVALECGHHYLEVRGDTGGLADAGYRVRRITGRTRCKQCPPVPSKGRARPPAAPPIYDPLVAALVAAAVRVATDDLGDGLLQWVVTHGRYVADDARRERAYRAIVLEIVDLYVGTSHPEDGPCLREAVQAWVMDPSTQNLCQARKYARRLYGRQHRGGSMYSNRGILGACAAMNARGRVSRILEAITWDAPTRDQFYWRMAINRIGLEAATAIGTPEQLAAAQGLLERASREPWPTIQTVHVPTVVHLLETYRREMETPGRGARLDGPCGEQPVEHHCRCAVPRVCG